MSLRRLLIGTLGTVVGAAPYLGCGTQNNNVPSGGSNNNPTNIRCDSGRDCGIDSFVSEGFCVGDDIWRDFKKFGCENPGTAHSYCNESISDELFEKCNEACLDGECVSGDIVACYKDSDCGVEAYFIGDPFCDSIGNVVGAYDSGFCANPGTINSYCEPQIYHVTLETCLNSCSNGVCVDDAASIDVSLPSDSGGNVAAVISGENNQNFIIYGDHDGEGNTSSLFGFGYESQRAQMIMIFGSSGAGFKNSNVSDYVDINGLFLMRVDINNDGSLSVIYDSGSESGLIDILDSAFPSCKDYLEESKARKGKSGNLYSTPENVCYIKDALFCVSAIGLATNATGWAGQVASDVDRAKDFAIVSCNEVGIAIDYVSERFATYQENLSGWVNNWSERLESIIDAGDPYCDRAYDGSEQAELAVGPPDGAIAFLEGSDDDNVINQGAFTLYCEFDNHIRDGPGSDIRIYGNNHLMLEGPKETIVIKLDNGEIATWYLDRLNYSVGYADLDLADKFLGMHELHSFQLSITGSVYVNYLGGYDFSTIDAVEVLNGD